MAARKRGLDVKLIIVDPLNRYNNIGKSSYNFCAIQSELRDVFNRLTEELIRFVKFVAARPPQEGSGGFQQPMGPSQLGASAKNSTSKLSGSNLESSRIEEADMIDGLIPRILQIDYKMSRPQEEVKQQQQSSSEPPAQQSLSKPWTKPKGGKLGAASSNR